MPRVTSRRLCASGCWPLSSHHWYKPIAPTRPDVVILHTWQSSACCISPTARTLARGLVQYSLLAFVMLILMVWLGSEYEQYHVHKAENTLAFYNQQPEVCGIVLTKQANTTSANVTASTSVLAAVTLSETPIQIETFSSADEVTAENGIVAHCGECGACSTPQDISIYDETRNTLFESSTACAKRGLIWGRRTAAKCMMEEVGFTEDCNDCWVENIMCDLRKCVFTCIWYGLFSQVDGGAGSGTTLNSCTGCDEKRCGPAFLECAGANRRRSGIISDIQRDEKSEVCQKVTQEWWKDPDLQRQWRAQQPVNDASPSDDKSEDTPRLRS
jgi:hypothetical protein